MITANKKLLSGSADEIRAEMEDLACGQDHRKYLAGTWFRELAVKLAMRDGLTVSAASYDDPPVLELEVILADAPHGDAIVIGRSQPGDHCQITLERWLPIGDEASIANTVGTIHSILAASVRPDRQGTDTATEA